MSRISPNQALGGGQPPHRGGQRGAPPPPSRHKGPVTGGRRDKQQHAQNQRQQQMKGAALSGIQNALIARGVDPGLAIRFAQIVLTRPGVTIAKNGIHYKGQMYDAKAFAGSKLADFVTGLAAQQQNQAAIQGESGYQTDLANATLQQQLDTAGLDNQQRQAILNFGSPAYTQDPLLAGEAAANPFSVEALLARQRAQNQQAATGAANRAGTLFGGGAQSGSAEVGRVYAGQQADSTQQLVDLLAGLSQQRAQAGSIFDTAKQTALQNATQRLMQSGAIHAASAPKLGIGQYHWWRPPHIGHVPDQNQQGGKQQPPNAQRRQRRPYPTPPPPPAL